MPTIRILLADDHAVVRDGIRRLLERQPDLEVIGAAADGVEAVEQARRLQPDVVIMDVSMPRLTGIEATQRIKEQDPGIRVIGLSMHQTSDVGVAIRQAGAEDFLAKTCAPQDLIAAIRQYATTS
jgi:DNA-binding NarL/FixJ family response regulator